MLSSSYGILLNTTAKYSGASFTRFFCQWSRGCNSWKLVTPLVKWISMGLLRPYLSTSTNAEHIFSYSFMLKSVTHRRLGGRLFASNHVIPSSHLLNLANAEINFMNRRNENVTPILKMTVELKLTNGSQQAYVITICETSDVREAEIALLLTAPWDM